MPCVGAGDGWVFHSFTVVSLQVFKSLTDVTEGALVKAFLIMTSFFVSKVTPAPVKHFVLPVHANIGWGHAKGAPFLPKRTGKSTVTVEVGEVSWSQLLTAS